MQSYVKPEKQPEVKPEVKKIAVNPEPVELKSSKLEKQGSKLVQIKESENEYIHEYYESQQTKSPEIPLKTPKTSKKSSEKPKNSENSKLSGFIKPGGLDKLWTSAKNNFRVKRTVRMIKVKAA